MKNYEIMYICKTAYEEVIQSVTEKFNSIINKNGGSVEKTDVWGKKRLAYEIQDLAEGIYILVSFQGSPACIKELDRVMRIDDAILRHMIISKGC